MVEVAVIVVGPEIVVRVATSGIVCGVTVVVEVVTGVVWVVVVIVGVVLVQLLLLCMLQTDCLQVVFARSAQIVVSIVVVCVG